MYAPLQVAVKRGTRVRFHTSDDTVDPRSLPLDWGSYTNSQLCATPPGASGTYQLEVDHVLQPGTYFFGSPIKERCLAGHKTIFAVDDD